MTTTEEQALKAAISRLSPYKKARRYPEHLRTQVTEFARRRLTEGASVAGVSKQLDVGEPTLTRFLAMPPARTSFTQVAIAEPELEREGPVVRAGGVVVEGLSVDETARLPRSLTCSA